MFTHQNNFINNNQISRPTIKGPVMSQSTSTSAVTFALNSGYRSRVIGMRRKERAFHTHSVFKSEHPQDTVWEYKHPLACAPASFCHVPWPLSPACWCPFTFPHLPLKFGPDPPCSQRAPASTLNHHSPQESRWSQLVVKNESNQNTLYGLND